MEIITSGHNYSDAVRQIIQLFFDLNSEGRVISSFDELTKTAYAEIEVLGKTANGKEICKNNNPTSRELSDTVKKSVFTACRKLSDMPTPWGISTGIRPAKTARELIEKGLSDSEILSYVQNEFWESPDKAKLSLSVAKREKEILDHRLKDGISIYVGIPFCPTRCSYCSFISQATKYNDKFIEPYVSALLLEIEHTARLAEKFGMKTETIYFGGGTPTTLSPKKLDVLIKAVKKHFDISLLKEFTVEAGRPDTFSEEMLQVLSENKVNRISINPQTMSDKTLELIGRKHSVKQTVKAFKMAKKYTDISINADVIAGLPEETTNDFKNTLTALTALNPDAVTVHTMYLKRAARLIDDFEKLRFASNVSEMVDFSYKYLLEREYFPYYMYKQKNTLGNLENVGYSKSGEECLYNIYIMEEVHTVLALGGGASTKIVRGDRIERVFNPKEAADYIRRIEEIKEKKDIAFKEWV